MSLSGSKYARIASDRAVQRGWGSLRAIRVVQRVGGCQESQAVASKRVGRRAVNCGEVGGEAGVPELQIRPAQVVQLTRSCQKRPSVGETVHCTGAWYLMRSGKDLKKLADWRRVMPGFTGKQDPLGIIVAVHAIVSATLLHVTLQADCLGRELCAIPCKRTGAVPLPVANVCERDVVAGLPGRPRRADLQVTREYSMPLARS